MSGGVLNLPTFFMDLWVALTNSTISSLLLRLLVLF